MGSPTPAAAATSSKRPPPRLWNSRDARALVGLRRAVGFRGAIERAPQVDLRRPLHVVGDEQVQLAVAVVIEPCGAGAEIRVLDAGRLCDVAELAVALVVEQAVAFERGDVDVVAAVVIVVGDGDAHAVHLDVEAAARGDVRECAVAIVAIEALAASGVRAASSPCC